MRSIGLVLTATLAVVVPAAAQAPPLAPLSTAVPLGSRTVRPAHVACTDQPTSSVPSATLHVLAPHAADLHDISTKNHVIVLNGGTLQGLRVGQQFFTRRLSPPVSGEPMTISTPGSIRTTGWLTVVAANDSTALARVDYACTGIESGDYLEPYVEPVLPVALAVAGQTNFADLGRVLFGVDRREAFGPGDFLSIDRGSAQGMVGGTRVGFYRDRGNGTPLFELGVGIVIEVSAETSKVVVERSSGEIRRGDYVGVRGRP